MAGQIAEDELTLIDRIPARIYTRFISVLVHAPVAVFQHVRIALGAAWLAQSVLCPGEPVVVGAVAPLSRGIARRCRRGEERWDRTCQCDGREETLHGL